MVGLSVNVLIFSVALSNVMLVSTISIFVSAGGPFSATTWTDAHATFYGGNDGSGTMGGACGYGNLISRGYRLNTAAVSSTLFNNGLTCGACFQLKCKVASASWCYATAGSITVTATSLCPENSARPYSDGGWCNQPKIHFDLAYSMFQMLAKPVGGIIPIQYRRVPCEKKGGVRFTLNGSPWFNLVLIHNVGGDGNVIAIQVKSSKTRWFTMKQNWGQNWEHNQNLDGQSLSFRVTTGFGKTLVLSDVAASNWQFGQTYESEANFR